MRANRVYAQLKEALLPVGLLVFTVFIFGPFTIYFGNPGELDVGYIPVLSTLAPLALAASAVLLIPACLLPVQVFRFYNPLLLGLGTALWLQGNVIVGSYGFLDGTPIDFAAQSWRVWHETALWLGVPALVILFYSRHKEKTLSVGRLVVALELLHLMAGGFGYPQVFRHLELDPFPEDAAVLSSQKNILQIVLDGFQSDSFSEVIERYPEFAEAFEGFVFFENSMGHFPVTRVSIPAILSGKVYRNQAPLDEFISEVMSAETLPAALHQSGYLVDMLTLRRYRYGDSYSNWYTVPRPFTDEKERRRFAAAEVLDLSLFRHLPHLVKPWVYQNQSWLIQSWVTIVADERKFEPSNSVAFMQYYRSQIRVGDQRPRYKFIHLLVPHLPLVLDGGCSFLGPRPQSRDAFIDQSACAVRVLVDFLNALRAQGAYEKSLIVVSADHGNRFPSEVVSARFEEPQLASRAAALLLLKPPGSRGKLATSGAPVCLSDIPATIAELAGIPNQFPGRSALQLGAGDQRDRYFYYHVWTKGFWDYDFFPDMREYLITGHVFDRDAWQLQGQVLPRQGAPDSSFIRLDLGAAHHRPHLGSGWGEDQQHAETTFAWGVGEAASVTLPRIPQTDTLLTARLIPAPSDRPQVITVFADDREIAKWNADTDNTWRVYSAIISSSDRVSGPVTIRFHFAEVTGPEKLAAAFDYIEAKPAKP